MMGVDVARG